MRDEKGSSHVRGTIVSEKWTPGSQGVSEFLQHENDKQSSRFWGQPSLQKVDSGQSGTKSKAAMYGGQPSLKSGNGGVRKWL